MMLLRREVIVAKIIRTSLLTIGLAAMASLCFAQSDPASPEDVRPTGPLASQMGIDQNFGAQVPLDAQFKDDTGKDVTFGEVLSGKPVILLPMFFGCNGVCRLEVEDLFKTLEKDKSLRTGTDFDVILLSIKPTETAELAAEKKKIILDHYRVKGADVGVHGLVGDIDNIRKVTDAVGFRYAYNPATQMVNHPAGLMVLDKNGIVRGYMYGAEFPTVVLSNNLKAAAQGVQGEKKPQIILLGCVMVDPVTGKRTIIIENLMKVIGTLTALTLGGSILYMSRKYKTRPVPSDHEGGNVTGV
jgi:protein SCO1